MIVKVQKKNIKQNIKQNINRRTMSGETNLEILLKHMKPELNAGEYVFCQTHAWEGVVSLEPLCSFREKEGWTMILPREKADSLGTPYTMTCAWITLTVHSALEAVGL